MKKHFFVILLSFIMLFWLPVAAETEGKLKVEYYSEESRVEGSLSLVENEAKIFTVALIKGGSAELSGEEILEYEENTYFYDHYIADSNGKFEFSFSLADDAPVGTYMVYSTDGEKTYCASFFRFSEEVCKENIKLLYSKTSYEEFEKLFWELFNNEQLPVTKSDYIIDADTKAVIADSFYNEKVLELGSFKNKFNEIYLLATLKNAQRGDIFDFIKNNSEILGVSAEYCDSLTSKQKIYFLNLIEGKTFASVEDFKECYEEAIALSWASGADNWQEIMKAVTTFDSPKADFEGDYKNVKDTSKVFKKMMGKAYESIEELLKGFDDAVDEVIYEQKTNIATPNQGGFGGGGRVGSTGGVAPTINNTPVMGYTEFKDIEGHSWAKDAVSLLQKKGVLSGDGNGNFYPGRNITRNEFVKMLVAAFSLENANAQTKFEDISSEGWEYLYVASAANLGIIKGKTDTYFGGNEYITREDMSLIIYRLASLVGISFNEKAEFSDSSEISEYALEAVSFMAGEGLVIGEGGKFSPKENAQRAQCAVIISRLLEKAGDVK